MGKCVYVYFHLAFYTYTYIFDDMSALKHIRVHLLGITQAEMAEIAGVTQATVSRWENGVSPSIDDVRPIRRWAQQKGIALDDAIFFDSPEECQS